MNSHRGSHGTESIHVLIANLSGVVAEMVKQTVQQQPDLKLLGSVEGWKEIDAAVAETDVLVLGADNVYSPPESCLRLLSDYPNLKLLVLTTTSDEAIAYWRALYCHQVQIISCQTLIEAIRQMYSLSPF
ncbi:MAG: hypothetical protein LH702_28150 [Phormidesmis sp. CAN_BIN44]|nr:hypothetical protein [Phormidesmis sp. CAN_BIN44]